MNLPPQWLYGQQAQWQVKALTCCCRTYSAEAAGVEKLATVLVFFSWRLKTIPQLPIFVSGGEVSVKTEDNC